MLVRRDWFQAGDFFDGHVFGFDAFDFNILGIFDNKLSRL